MKIEFFHQCLLPKTTGQQQKRVTKKGKVYTDKQGNAAMALLQAIFERNSGGVSLSGPVVCSMSLTWPGEELEPKATRPDADNLAKMVLDAATRAGVWKDDGQVWSLTVRKYRGPVAGLAFFAEEATTDENP